MSSIDFRRSASIQSTRGCAPAHCQRVGNGAGDLIIYTTESCTSTMDLAWILAAEERFPEWASILARSQTSGRGQFDRRWHSPPGNIYGSLRLPLLEPVWNNLLPLVLAESVYGQLKELGLAPAIKWPNDLLVAGQKVGGILVETRSGLSLAGVGLNLVSAPQLPELRHPLAPPAGCLREFGLDLEAPEFWLSFVRRTRCLIEEILAQGDPKSFLAGLNSHLAHIDERILLEPYGASERPVIFQGLDVSGGITALTTEGERVFLSGRIYPLV